jgi:formylglycine-generating enzyme required for sulfatase activity
LLPVNCIEIEAARALCQGRGGRLPTEAQWEYVGTNLGRSRFPWGSESPSCADAVIGRVSTGVEFDFFCTKENPRVYPLGPAAIPQEGDPRGRDIVQLGGRRIYDLGANLSEFTEDAPNDASGSCWRPGGLQVDPVCREATVRGVISSRGGSYTLPHPSVFPSLRPGQSSFEVGVRCAYADEP